MITGDSNVVGEVKGSTKRSVQVACWMAPEDRGAQGVAAQEAARSANRTVWRRACIITYQDLSEFGAVSPRGRVGAIRTLA